MPFHRRLLTIISLIIFLSYHALNVSGQIHDALIFVMDKPGTDILEIIQYPPGTTYQVTELGGDEVRFYEKERHILSYEGDFKIAVFPNYKDGADIIEKKDLRLRIVHSTEGAEAIDLPSLYKRIWREKNEKSEELISHDYGRYDGNVTLSKKLTPSESIPNTFNVIAQFSNGIQFIYHDGEASASLGDTELEIEGKFQIFSELGIARLSFNPHNGVIWYVFEEKMIDRPHK